MKNLILDALKNYDGQEFTVNDDLLTFVQNIKVITHQVVYDLLNTSFNDNSCFSIYGYNSQGMQEDEEFIEFLSRMFIETDDYTLDVYSSEIDMQEDVLLGTITYNKIEAAFLANLEYLGMFLDGTYKLQDADYIINIVLNHEKTAR